MVTNAVNASNAQTVSGNPTAGVPIVVGTWGGAGWWGLGSANSCNNHNLRFDKILSNAAGVSWNSASDINLYLGPNLVLTTASIGAYALPITGGTVTGSVYVNTSTASTSPTTGALRVAGGVGISGCLNVGGTINAGNITICGSNVLTLSGLGSYGVTKLTAGTDTSVNTTTGAVTLWTTSTLQSVTNRGSTTTNAINISNATASASTTTGALIVAGGVGVGGNLYVGGNLNTAGTITATTFVGTLTGVASSATYAVTAGYANSFNTNTLVTNSVNAVNATTSLFATTSGYAQSFNTATLVATAVTANSLGSGAYKVTNNTPSTTTATGAFQVSGGVGIGGCLNVGGTINAGNITICGSNVLTLSGLGSYGVTKLIAGTDTAISTSSGNVTIWDTSTFQTVSNRGSTTTNAINITNATASNSSTTGALRVAGGVGIGGSLYIANTSYVAGAQIITTATIANYAASGVTTGTTSTFVISNNTQATSTTTGALVVQGGAGIGGNLYVGGIISSPLGSGGSITGASLITTAGLVVNGTFTSTNVQDVIGTIAGPTGTVNYNLNAASVWYNTAPTANWTANFTNVSLTQNRSTVATVIVVQGSTPYAPTAVQINGTPATIAWFNAGTAPPGIANNIDIFSFGLLNIGGTWTVLGQYSTY